MDSTETDGYRDYLLDIAMQMIDDKVDPLAIAQFLISGSKVLKKLGKQVAVDRHVKPFSTTVVETETGKWVDSP